MYIDNHGNVMHKNLNFSNLICKQSSEHFNMFFALREVFLSSQFDPNDEEYEILLEAGFATFDPATFTEGLPTLAEYQHDGFPLREVTVWDGVEPVEVSIYTDEIELTRLSDCPVIHSPYLESDNDAAIAGVYDGGVYLCGLYRDPDGGLFLLEYIDQTSDYPFIDEDGNSHVGALAIPATKDGYAAIVAGKVK